MAGIDWTVRIFLIPAIPSLTETPFCHIYSDGQDKLYVYPARATVEDSHRQAKVILADTLQRADDPSSAAELVISDLASIAARISFMAVRSYRVAGLSVGVIQENGDFVSAHEVWWVPKSGAVGPRTLFPERKIGDQASAQHLLREDIDDQTERALQWLWHGLGAFDATAQFMAYWIGLEVLAPPVKSPWRCSRCRHVMPECPNCGVSTERKVWGETMRAFLLGLGASEPLPGDLLRLRHAIFHGRTDDNANLDPVTLAVESGRLLQKAIKRNLHLPQDEPPDFGESTFTLDGFAPIGKLADDERVEIDCSAKPGSG